VSGAWRTARASAAGSTWRAWSILRGYHPAAYNPGVPPDRPRVVLASASPRRAALLSAAGADQYVRRLAIAKAVAVAARHPGALVLGADTTVAVDGDILGKPADAADAARMLRRLAGRAHSVHTGVALARDGEVRADVATTTVWFEPMTETDIGAYVASGEPMDKAGAYGIQGRASRFVRRLDGPFDNVVGLPVDLVHALIRAFPAQVGFRP
jgi:septum formation protein